jgi:hypothetical protein
MPINNPMMTAIMHAMMKIFLRLQKQNRIKSVRKWAEKAEKLHLLFWYSCACRTSQNQPRLLIIATPCRWGARRMAMQAMRTVHRAAHLYQLFVAVFYVIFRQGNCGHQSRSEAQPQLC